MRQEDILLITPPFTQLNTPYPATAYIKGFLKTLSISACQMDLGIEVILKLFTKSGISDIFNAVENHDLDENSERILAMRSHYESSIDAVISFLQGHQPTLARKICEQAFLPEASRFNNTEQLDLVFGSMGFQDKAKHLATLYLEDLSDFIVTNIDPYFGFSRYAERLGRSANSFDELYDNLQLPSSYVDEITLSILGERLQTVQPKLVCFSVPFPGNLYSAFRCAQFIKTHYPNTKIAMGGGFPNTELRSVTDKRVFEFFDFIALDDGERPLERIIDYVIKLPDQEPALKRTFMLQNDEAFYNNLSTLPDYKQAKVGTPDYSDLRLNQYISVIEITNPMHSLWSDGRWNKLTMAHGCYWGKCTFCDVSLDYIKLYEPVAVRTLVDRMETLINETGERGFHFVDEAAPPALMKELAIEILRRKLDVSWWANIRFEKSFSGDLCKLLQASGCIAISGGLEVASDRLLQLIKKGVTVEQVAQVTRNFTASGIMVHAYLMYGYPTQTKQETIDSLEMVRQLFESGVIQSGFWHQFALTAHSPVGLDPEAFGVIPHLEEITFANNDVAFTDKTGIDHSKFSYGLKKSLFNYMHGIGFEMPLSDWFDHSVPKTNISPEFIYDCLEIDSHLMTKPTARILWIGTQPLVRKGKKKGKSKDLVELVIHLPADIIKVKLPAAPAKWILEVITQLSQDHKAITFGDLQADYQSQFGDDLEPFWYSEEMTALKAAGLLAI